MLAATHLSTEHGLHASPPACVPKGVFFTYASGVHQVGRSHFLLFFSSLSIFPVAIDLRLTGSRNSVVPSRQNQAAALSLSSSPCLESNDPKAKLISAKLQTNAKRWVRFGNWGWWFLPSPSSSSLRCLASCDIYGCVLLALAKVLVFQLTPPSRKTPIGYLHRFLRHRLPALLLFLDNKLTSSALTPFLQRCGHYLMNEKHPLVMIFYLVVVTGGAYMFLSAGWRFLPTSQRILALLVLPLPYLSLHLCARSDPGIITAANHASAMGMYPFDNMIFFPSPPTPPCRTCRLGKPARSKHCSICRACVAKHDHHCVWINNCVGLNNTRHFLFFLVSTNLLLAVGAGLSYGILEEVLRRSGVDPRGLPTWGEWSRYMSAAVIHEVYVGAVFLLCVLCSLLGSTFTVYHLYLIWAGTTTNETGKWADWREDIRDGMIFRADKDPDVNDDGQTNLYRVEGGRTEDLPRGMLWTRVEGLHEITNAYDQGGWANFWDVILPRKLQ